MSAINYLEMGKKIKERRKEKGLTQAVLAEKMGVSDRTIKSWEMGKLEGKVNISNLLELFSILDIDMNYLLGNDYPTVKVQKICEYTGLSKDSVKILNKNDYEGTKYTGALISRYLETYNEKLIDLLCQMDNYFSSKLRYEEVRKIHPDYNKKRVKYDDIKQYEEIKQVEFFEKQANAELLACMNIISEMYAIARNDPEVIEEAGFNS